MVYSLHHSLGILSPEISVQGYNSSIFLGIHPFAKGLGLMFSRFVHSIHKKSSVCLTHHSRTSIKLMALSRKNRYIDYKQRDKSYSIINNRSSMYTSVYACQDALMQFDYNKYGRETKYRVFKYNHRYGTMRSVVLTRVLIDHFSIRHKEFN